MYGVLLNLKDWSRYPMLELLNFKDQHLIPKLKLSLVALNDLYKIYIKLRSMFDPRLAEPWLDQALMDSAYLSDVHKSSVSEFNEFNPRLKSPQKPVSIERRLKSWKIEKKFNGNKPYLSPGLNLSPSSNSLNSVSEFLESC